MMDNHELYFDTEESVAESTKKTEHILLNDLSDENLLKLSTDELIENIDFTEAQSCAYIVYSLIKNRSTLAEDFLANCLQNVKDIKALAIGDITTNDWLIANGFNGIDSNKTPDIHFIINDNIVLGDVAVTKNVNRTDINKTVKYDVVKTMITESNPGVSIIDFNFILEHDLSNLQSIITDLRDRFGAYSTRLVKSDFITKVKRINNIIFDIRRKVTDKNLFEECMEGFSRNIEKHDFTDEIIKENEEDYDYKPKLTEKELFDIIMAESMKPDNTTEMSEITDINDIYAEIKSNNDKNYPVDRGPRTPLQYIMNLDGEENVTGLMLLKDYCEDLMFSENCMITTIVPNLEQLVVMNKINEESKQRTNTSNMNNSIIGFRKQMMEKYGQSDAYFAGRNNMMSNNLENNLYKEYAEKGLRKNVNPNEIQSMIANSSKRNANRFHAKKEVSSISSKHWNESFTKCEKLANYLSGQSLNLIKSANLHFDMPQGDTAYREKENIDIIKPIYDKVNSSRGAIMASCVRKWANDCARLSKKMKDGIYYSVPIQGNCIFCTMTNTNLARATPYYNYFTITRYKKGEKDVKEMKENIRDMFDGIIKEFHETPKYLYVTSILFKVSLEVLSTMANIDAELRTHCMVMSLSMTKRSYFNSHDGKFLNAIEENRIKDASLILDAMSKNNVKSRENPIHTYSDYLDSYIGNAALLMCDTHQTPSMILDLMKYIVGINFSSNSSIGELLVDKLNLMIKTNLDVYLIMKLVKYINNNLRLRNFFNCQKFKMTKAGPSDISYEHVGLFNSFWLESLVTNDISFYLHEGQMMTQMRPKNLYGDQFLCKAAAKVSKNNKIYLNDEKEEPGCTLGTINNNKFRFDLTFPYSKDAVYHAQVLMNNENRSLKKKQQKKIYGMLHEFAINNLSMRGSCKLREEMVEGKGKSQTSLYSGIKFLEPHIVKNNSESCKIYNVARDTINREESYNMSRKSQRFGGRAIGSADYPTKIKLHLNESVFKILSSSQNENLLVQGVNRAQKITVLTREVMHEAYKNGYSDISHIVMDQKQFSEEDNTNKFIDFIKFNENIPQKLKPLMVRIEKGHQSRTQYWKKLSKNILDEEKEYVRPFDGIFGIAGWVQGMKNIMSTYTHIASVKWLYKIFCDYYEENGVKQITDETPLIMRQIVNSDDSYMAVSGKSKRIIRQFHKFIVTGKKLFRLIENVKKSYISDAIGEIIQKYVINGCVENIYGKAAVSCFNSNLGVNLAKDILGSVGTLQSLIRDGSPEVLCTYVRAELKNQVFTMYNMGYGKFNDISKTGCEWSNLPCELGGWPSNVTTFELCCSGTYSQLNYCNSYYNENKDCNEYKIVKASMGLCIKKNYDKEEWSKYISFKRSKNDDIKNIDTTNEDSETRTRINIAKLIVEQNTSNSLANSIQLDEINPNDIDETKDFEKAEITMTNIGLRDHDGSAAKSLISCVGWFIPLGNKQSRTVEYLRSFDYEGSGLSGLYVNRENIQQAVGDIRDRMNDYILQMSEEGHMKNIRRRLYLNSAAATQNSCSVGGMPIRTSLYNSIVVLLRSYDIMKFVGTYSVSSQMVDRVLSDPTGRANICKSIIENYRIEGRVLSGGKVVNHIPYTEDVIDLKNDLRSVLIEMIKPGFLKTQHHVFISEERLQSDIETVNTIYHDWFTFSDSKSSVCVSIYRHHLNVRRSRYLIGPRMRANTQSEFLKGVFESCQIPGIRIYGSIGERNLMDLKLQGKQDMRENVATLTSAFKVVDYMQKYNNLSPKSSSKEIVCSLFTNGIAKSNTLYDILTKYSKTVFENIYNFADLNDKKILSLLHYNVTDSVNIIQDILTIEDISVDFIKEQKKSFIYENGIKRTIWQGKFVIRVTKGSTTAIIEGEPGNIQNITGNTLDIEKLVPLFYRLVKTVPFYNFHVPKSISSWGDTTFWMSTNPNTDYKILYSRNFSSTLTLNTNTVKNEREDKIQTMINKALEIKTGISDFIPWIPYTYDPLMKYKNLKTEKFHDFEVDDNKVYGVKDVIERFNMNGRSMSRVKRDSVLLFKYNRSFKKMNFVNMQFSSLSIDNVYLDKLNGFNLLKDVIRGELDSVSRNTAQSFIVGNFDRSEIIFEFMKNFVQARTGTSFESIYSNEKENETEVIEITSKFYDNNEDEEYMIEVDDDFSSNIMLQTIESRVEYTAKNLRKQLMSLSMGVTNKKDQTMIVKACVNSKMMTKLRMICERIKKVSTLDREPLVTEFLNKEIMEQVREFALIYDVVDKGNPSVNTICKKIISSGLMIPEKWNYDHIMIEVESRGMHEDKSKDIADFTEEDMNRELAYGALRRFFSEISGYNKISSLRIDYESKNWGEVDVLELMSEGSTSGSMSSNSDVGGLDEEGLSFLKKNDQIQPLRKVEDWKFRNATSSRGLFDDLKESSSSEKSTSVKEDDEDVDDDNDSIAYMTD